MSRRPPLTSRTRRLRTMSMGLVVAAATLSVGASATPTASPPSLVLGLVFGARVQVMPMQHGPSEDPGANAQFAPSLAASAQLTYYGGRVVSNAKVYQVSWGPSVDTKVQSGLGAFYTAITNSDYFDWLAEYDTVGRNGSDGQSGSNQHIGRGSFGRAIEITPAAQGTSLSDDQIQAELAAQTAAGKLPTPDLDAAGNVNAVYMIDFPPGVTITGPGGSGQSCVQFCAYHSTVVIGGRSVPYGVLPDLGGPCSMGCGMDPAPFNNATAVHSHELVEAITDAEVGVGAANSVARPLAWYDAAANTGEIGDICNAQHATVAGFVVQTEWSNSQGACIASRPLPTCGTAAPPCTPCTAAPSSCTGATPVCASDQEDFKLGQCVACADSSACSAKAPVCDKSRAATDDTCRGCTSNADCGTAAPTCQVATGKCIECLTSSDCKAPAACDTSANVCVECTTNAQCANPAPACGQNRKCDACRTSADCAGNTAGALCATSGACASCLTDADCGSASNPSCDPGVGACVPQGTVGQHGTAAPKAQGNGDMYGGFAPPNTNAGSCSASASDARAGVFAGAALLAALALARRRRLL